MQPKYCGLQGLGEWSKKELMQRQELAAAEEKELKWIGSVKKLEMSNNIIVCAYFSFFQMKEN